MVHRIYWKIYLRTNSVCFAHFIESSGFLNVTREVWWTVENFVQFQYHRIIKKTAKSKISLFYKFVWKVMKIFGTFGGFYRYIESDGNSREISRYFGSGNFKKRIVVFIFMIYLQDAGTLLSIIYNPIMTPLVKDSHSYFPLN